MTDEQRQEIRAAVRQEVAVLLSQMLTGLLTVEPPKAAAPVPVADPEAFDRFLGRIADAKTPEELTQFELVEREGPNRAQVFAAIGARMEALRGAAR